jgi:hypothetical protein
VFDPVGISQPGVPVAHDGEQDGVSDVRGLDAQRAREVGLPASGRAEEDDVAGVPQERAVGGGGDMLRESGLGIDVEVLGGLYGREPGDADPQPGARGVAGGAFPLRTAAR